MVNSKQHWMFPSSLYTHQGLKYDPTHSSSTLDLNSELEAIDDPSGIVPSLETRLAILPIEHSGSGLKTLPVVSYRAFPSRSNLERLLHEDIELS
jgi:hypothetical protein